VSCFFLTHSVYLLRLLNFSIIFDSGLLCAIEKLLAHSRKCVFVAASVQLNLMTTLSFQGSWTWCRIQFKGWLNLKVCFTLNVFFEFHTLLVSVTAAA